MNNFITFIEAHSIVKKLNIKNTNEWRRWIKNNKQYNIPYNPDIYYKNKGWVNWKHFLNKEFKLDFISYDDAKKLIQNENIKNNIQFKKWIKNNIHTKIPKSPEITYKNKGWKSWGDFLNTNNTYSKNFMTYSEAISLLHKLNLKSMKEYLEYIKNNNINLPTNPNVFYDEFTSVSEYLNSGFISNSKKEFLSYKEAKKIVEKEKINSINEFIKWNRPKNIPSDPVNIYKKEWTSWGDFLGTIIKTQKEKGESFISFNEAKSYLKKLNLRHKFDYHEHIVNNNIDFLPKRPDYFYKKEWSGYLDYLNCEGLRSSYGERKIKEFLDEKNINYEREKKFETCINKQKNKLPFDFYLIDQNVCIEYDGQHHFNSVSKYGGESFLKKVQHHDKIKNNWCKQNNIKLIRISYKQKSKIEKILNSVLI
jgi:hypothetical protein